MQPTLLKRSFSTWYKLSYGNTCILIYSFSTFLHEMDKQQLANKVRNLMYIPDTRTAKVKTAALIFLLILYFPLVVVSPSLYILYIMKESSIYCAIHLLLHWVTIYDSHNQWTHKSCHGDIDTASQKFLENRRTKSL